MDYEYVLLQKKGIKVYNIPPMSSNQGHFLDSWKNKITEVNLKIMGKGHKCTVYLHNYDGSLFASALIPERYDQAVVKCADSSRGYALRLQDPSGKTAWIGVVFSERNDSFDFHACLEDFEKNRDMELNPQKYAAENKPTQNFALKKGEKISFNVGGGDSGFNKPKPTSNANDFKLPPPGNSFGLPPPESTSFKLPPPNSQPKTSQPQGGNNFGDFSNFGNFNDFSNFGNNTGSNPSQGGGFSNFGSNTQQKQNNFDLLGDINFSAPPSNQSNQSNQWNQNQASKPQDNFDLL